LGWWSGTWWSSAGGWKFGGDVGRRSAVKKIIKQQNPLSADTFLPAFFLFFARFQRGSFFVFFVGGVVGLPK